MNTSKECVVDTSVLQKANAPLTQPRQGPDFAKRLRLLKRIQVGELKVLISSHLFEEYQRQVSSPRNDFVKAFFELLGSPDRRVSNWSPWPSRDREKARKCRYPQEDDHVLRTARREDRSTTIICEERRMLLADACIYRKFRVHICRP